MKNAAALCAAVCMAWTVGAAAQGAQGQGLQQGGAQPGLRSTDPNVFTRNAVETVVKASKADPAAKTGDVDAMSKVVEREFLPYTDFARTTRLAVGAAWQSATPPQREQLVAEFTKLLVRTYALQLTQLGGQEIAFSYSPAKLGPKGDDAVVEAQINMGSDPVSVGYRLAKTAVGWRIYDIDMMGLWLIQLYQKQFEAALRGGGIDGLLKYLAEHNARFQK